MTPRVLPPDERGGERYECHYCKFKWRIVKEYDTHCKGCLEDGLCVGVGLGLGVGVGVGLGVGLGVAVPTKAVSCRLCRAQHLISEVPCRSVLCLW
jgi:hypothetical protein